MPTNHHQIAAIRAGRELIERAARALRDFAIRDGYSGSSQPARAFSLPCYSTSWGVTCGTSTTNCAVVVQSCRTLLGETA